ncbi:hypothetical protein [Nostoc sp.]|uniref:hypothetical protein n=1 Tax=Nostoc sp. TaxID=1180 RepID=UPI002FFA76E9
MSNDKLLRVYAFPLGGRFMSIAQAKRFTLDEYHRLTELGFFHEDDHIELINGEIIELEIRRKFNYEISLFSGVDFTVDSQRGLNGFCDFILSLSSEQLLVRSPVIVLVESKNENLRSGLAQCIAEMVAAQLFNERGGNKIKAIYGAVTIGTIWQFLQLEGNVVSIDLSEYYIKEIKKILGILYSAIAQSKP